MICSVADPPGVPRISGLRSGARVTTGTRHQLTCQTRPAGHPPAQLVWFMGDEMVDSQYTVEGDTAMAQITFVPQPENNGSELRCEAFNKAMDEPVFQAITIDVASKSDTKSTTTTTTTEEYYIYEYEADKTTTEDPLETNSIYDYLEGQKDVNQIVHEPKEEDTEYYENEEYQYEYPEEDEFDEQMLIHPELTNEMIFQHKILPPTEYDDERGTSKKTKSVNGNNKAFNEVYPKDSPYTQSSIRNGAHRNLITALSALFVLRALWPLLRN